MIIILVNARRKFKKVKMCCYQCDKNDKNMYSIGVLHTVSFSQQASRSMSLKVVLVDLFLLLFFLGHIQKIKFATTIVPTVVQ